MQIIHCIYTCNLLSFFVEQRFKRADKLQVRGGRDIVMALQFQEESLRQVACGGVEGLTDVGAAYTLLIIQLHILQEAIGHGLQSILWPGLQKTSTAEFR